MKSTSILQNYTVKQIKPNLIPPFNKPEHAEKLKNLLTDRKESVVEFDLIGISDKQANAIRRTLIDEIEVLALDFNPQNLETNYEFILRDEVRDRIRFIPIGQDLQEGTVFSLDVLNNNLDNGYMTVYSSDLKGSGSQKISGKIRIAELKPGSYIRIPKITVIKGLGRRDSMFSLTCDMFYDNLDYMDIHKINKKANILTQRVSVAELLAVMKKLGHSKINKRELVDKKVLVIPNPEYDKLLTKSDRARIEMANYDYTLIIKEAGVSLNPQSSSMVASTEFQMRVYLLGNVPGDQLLKMVCDNLIKRLQTVRDGIAAIKKHGTDPNGMVEKSERLVVVRDHQESNQTLTVLKIRGETHTIGEMLVKHVYLLDTGIMNIKKRMNHPSESQVFIDIIHPNPLAICLDALDGCIQVYKQIIIDAQKM